MIACVLLVAMLSSSLYSSVPLNYVLSLLQSIYCRVPIFLHGNGCSPLLINTIIEHAFNVLFLIAPLHGILKLSLYLCGFFAQRKSSPKLFSPLFLLFVRVICTLAPFLPLFLVLFHTALPVLKTSFQQCRRRRIKQRFSGDPRREPRRGAHPSGRGTRSRSIR